MRGRCQWPLLFVIVLAISVRLRAADLGRVKWKRDFHAVPQKAREARHSPHSSFPGEENSLRLGNFLLAMNSASLGDKTMRGQ